MYLFVFIDVKKCSLVSSGTVVHDNCDQCIRERTSSEFQNTQTGSEGTGVRGENLKMAPPQNSKRHLLGVVAKNSEGVGRPGQAPPTGASKFFLHFHSHRETPKKLEGCWRRKFFKIFRKPSISYPWRAQVF